MSINEGDLLQLNLTYENSLKLYEALYSLMLLSIELGRVEEIENIMIIIKMLIKINPDCGIVF
jgi:hypothetical protein